MSLWLKELFEASTNTKSLKKFGGIPTPRGDLAGFIRRGLAKTKYQRSWVHSDQNRRGSWDFKENDELGKRHLTKEDVKKAGHARLCIQGKEGRSRLSATGSPL